MKNEYKSNKGITLVALTVTVIVLIILASVATYSGINVANSARLTAFTMELKIAQTKVNELYNNMKNEQKLVIEGVTYSGEEDNSENNTKGYKNIGNQIENSDSQAKKAITAANSYNNSYSLDIINYKKIDTDIMKKFGFDGIEQILLIDVSNRKVVSYNGIEYNEKTYYILEQLPSGVYNVGYDNKNTGKPDFDVNYEDIGNGKYRINISNVKYESGNIEKWQVKYQVSSTSATENWNVSDTLSFIVSDSGTYKIKIFNDNIESAEKDLEILDKNTEYTDKNGDVAIIPAGFSVSENENENVIDTGLVIIGPDESEFVWVPVDKNTLCADGTAGKEMAIKSGDTNYTGVFYDFSMVDGHTTSTTIRSDINPNREPYVLTNYSNLDNSTSNLSVMNTILGTSFNSSYDLLDYMQKEYNEIVNSIKTNGGFYVGRYESSLNTSNNIQSKPNIESTSSSNSNTQMWYGLYSKQNVYANIIQGITIKSSMIYGSTYDAMLNWILNGEDNTKVTALGAEQDKMNNIFDLKGGLLEWTAEANYNGYRYYRGRQFSLYYKFCFSLF